MKTKLLLTLVFVFTITLQGQNKLLSSITQSYNGTTWENNYGSNYEYNTSSKLVSTTDLEWISSQSVWKNSSKLIYIYNANSKAESLIFQSWNTSNNSFVNMYKEGYSYNSSNNVHEIISQNWSGGTWENENKTTILYQGSLISEYIGYDWDGMQWQNDSRGTFNYNSNNKCTGNIEYNWENNQWVVASRDTYVYNLSNQLTFNKNEKWESNSWVEDSNYTYTLDAQGNRTEEIQSYDYLTQKSKIINNYDSSSLMSSFTHPFIDKTGLDYLFQDFPYINKIVDSEEYAAYNGATTFVINAKTTYDYNNIISLSTDNFQLRDVSLKLYPNPAINYIKVSGLTDTQNFEIYTILGAKVKNGTASDNTEINVENLVNGVYFLKLGNGKNIKFKKQ